MSYKVILSTGNKGCRFNNILLTRIWRFLLDNGHQVVRSPEIADYVIVNSCGIFEGFENHSLALSKKHSQSGRTQVLLLGCVSLINQDLPKKHQDVIFLKRPEELNRIFEVTKKFEEIKPAFSCQSFVNEHLSSPPRGSNRINQFSDKVKHSLVKWFLPKNSHLLHILDEIKRKDKYFVEISRGCIGKCTYCIERKARPEIKSRNIDDILDDISIFYKPHLRLCLAADDCGAYGLDIGKNIFDLLDAIHSRFPELNIELCNMYPFWIEKYEDKYLELIKTSRIHSVNIPLQSGSQRVLKKMNRRYSLENVLRIVNKMKHDSPKTLVWTHILAGFPGETREDFEASLRVVEAFDYFHCYLYSERTGTSSVELDGKISETEIQRRGREMKKKSTGLLLKRFRHEILSRPKKRLKTAS